MAKISHDSEVRADTKKFLPGIYELPGGHIDFGEDIVAGLQREIREELHMTVTVGEPFAAFTYRNEIKGAHSVEVVYFGRFVEPIEQVTIQPEDHSEYGWFSRQEVVARRDAIVAGATAGGDVEYESILRGFDLLTGENLKFS